MIYYKIRYEYRIMDESEYEQAWTSMPNQVLPLIPWNKMESV